MKTKKQNAKSRRWWCNIRRVGIAPGTCLFKLLGRVWRVEAVAHTGKAITAHTANDGKFMRRQFAISAPVYPTYTT